MSTEMNKEQLAFFATARLTSDQLSCLTGDQLSCLTSDQLRCLTSDQLSCLTSDQLSCLTSDQLSCLTGDQLSCLTSDQLRWLTSDQLSCLTSDQLRCLTSDQLSCLTSDQLSCLTSDRSELKVENLYSKIFAGLSESNRVLDQKTFGPDCDPASNLCRTPMCIAGHTVNCAGKAGYELAKAFGHAAAARMIHEESRPDVAEPRYDVYPNEWALAYIEIRAAEEAAASVHAQP